MTSHLSESLWLKKTRLRPLETGRIDLPATSTLFDMSQSHLPQGKVITPPYRRVTFYCSEIYFILLPSL